MVYGNEYSAIHKTEIDSIKKKLEAKQRNLDAITTVKGYKDPASKLVKTQEYYISQLENRPSILEGKCKEIEDKITLRKNRKTRDTNELNAKLSKLTTDFNRRESELIQELEDCRNTYKDKSKIINDNITIINTNYDTEIKRLEDSITDIKNNDSETKRLEKEIDSLADQILNTRTNGLPSGKTELVLCEELKALRQQLKDAERQYKEAIDAQEFLARKEKETDEVREEMWHPWSELKNIGEEERSQLKEVKKNNRLYPEGKPEHLPEKQDVVLEQFKSIVSHMSKNETKPKSVSFSESEYESNTNSIIKNPLPVPLVMNTKSPKLKASDTRPFKMSEQVLEVERELDKNKAQYKREGLQKIEEQRKRYNDEETRLKRLYFDAEISRDELEEQLRLLRGWKEGQ